MRRKKRTDEAGKYHKTLREQIQENRALAAVYIVLRALVVLMMVAQFFNGNFENVFLCVLTLVLFMIPSFIERTIKIDVPDTLEVIILLFIFAAEILGEINSFYTIIPGWDTMLHTINGFLVAAVGFCLVDLFDRSERFSFKLSPLFLAIVAFCFSMTVGVLWEFFEFGADQFLGTDMQKDFIVQEVNSVSLNPSGLNTVVHEPIESLVVNGEDWMEFPGGYLDVGLIDTMKDLQVNFVGAVAFSVIGYFYVKNRGKGKLAASLIPIVLDPEVQEENKENLQKNAPDREPDEP